MILRTTELAVVYITYTRGGKDGRFSALYTRALFNGDASMTEAVNII